MNEYELKKQKRIERLQQRAEMAREEANATYARAREMADAIPLGQPIIRNSTYQTQINYRRRMSDTFERSFEQSKKADYLEQKAEAAANNSAISSDDPDAIKKLEAKLEKEISDYENLKARAKTKKLKIPDFVRANTTARIRSIKQRIERLKKLSAREDKSYTIGEIRVEECTKENRIRLYFPGKPEEEMRHKLKTNGFRWSPTNGAWQAYLTQAWKVKRIFNL